MTTNDELIERCARAGRAAYNVAVEMPHLPYDDLTPARRAVWQHVVSAVLAEAASETEPRGIRGGEAVSDKDMCEAERESESSSGTPVHVCTRIRGHSGNHFDAEAGYEWRAMSETEPRPPHQARRDDDLTRLRNAVERDLVEHIEFGVARIRGALKTWGGGADALLAGTPEPAPSEPRPPDERRQQAEKRWNDAIDWLLNSRHTADPDIQGPFWAHVDGEITLEELRKS